MLYPYNEVSFDHKRNEVLVTLQHGCILETLHYMKEARHRRPHIVWFHSYEMPKTGKSREIESRLVVAKN